MKAKLFEGIVGIIVLLAIIYSSVFLLDYKEVSRRNTYVLYADFNNVNGIDIGNHVKINGFKIGSVVGKSLQDNLMVRLKLSIQKNISLTEDSVAEILHDSIVLGSKHINIIQGTSDVFLKPEMYLQYTQPAFNIEQVITNYLMSFAKNK